MDKNLGLMALQTKESLKIYMKFIAQHPKNKVLLHALWGGGRGEGRGEKKRQTGMGGVLKSKYTTFSP